MSKMLVFFIGMGVGIIITMALCFIFTALISKSVEEFYEDDDER